MVDEQAEENECLRVDLDGLAAENVRLALENAQLRRVVDAALSWHGTDNPRTYKQLFDAVEQYERVQ